MSVEIVFWDVDTQHDFIDADGNLPVDDGAVIRPNLEKLTRFARRHGIPIVASADAHPPGDPEFEEFGQHCKAGTPGQEKIDETTAEPNEVVDPERIMDQLRALEAGELAQLIIEKEELDVFTEPVADTVLRELDPEHVYVYGVATEYCVLRTVRGIAERGYEQTFLTDAIRPVEEDAADEALDEMEGAGAHPAETDEVLRELEA